MQGFGKEWWCVWSLEKKETPERVIRSGVFSFGCLTGRSVLRRYKGIATDGVSRCRIAPSEGWRRIG
jgi:hypothetical protein